MISLPIIFREFRVAARHKRTFVFRSVFGGLLAFMALMFVIIMKFSGGSSGSGYYLLQMFSWLIFVLLFVFAPAVTCGCIADEKKQGTLGLLFLTHLNSADIVLGKFVSRGLDLVLLFLSATPFLFVPVLMGGVNWEVTFSAVLCISSLLVLALAFGVFASTYSRFTAQAVISGYVGLILYNVVMGILPQLAEFLSKGGAWQSFAIWVFDYCKMASPALALAVGGTHNAFVSFLWSGSVALVLVGLSVWKLPRTLQTESFRQPFWRSVRGWFSPSVRTIRKRTGSGSMIDRNPLLWLSYSRYGNWMMQLIVVAIICVLAAWAYTALSGDIGRAVFWGSLKGIGWLLGFCIRILILVSVARSFATEKEDGSLELLLTTPITNRQIVQSRVVSVLLRFGLLYGLACVLQLASGITGDLGIWVFELVSDISGLLYLMAVGLWISVWSKTVTQSIMLTIFAVILVGWFLTMVGYMLIAMLSMLWFTKVAGVNPAKYMQLVIGFGTLGLRSIVELAMASLAYGLLIRNFRQYATR